MPEDLVVSVASGQSVGSRLRWRGSPEPAAAVECPQDEKWLEEEPRQRTAYSASSIR